MTLLGEPRPEAAPAPSAPRAPRLSLAPEALRLEEVDALADLGATGQRWRAVEALCPEASPFVRWPWVSAWLQVYGAPLGPRLLLGRRGQRLVGAALVGRGRIWRHRLFPIRQLHLNTSGERGPSGACVEFNRLLCAERERAAFSGALADHLGRSQGWDELSLAGFLPEEMPALGPLSDLRERPCYAMDLRLLRERRQEPEDALSSNTRQQIRRSLRLFGGRGALRLEEARGEAEAAAYLEELVDLHQGWWGARGRQGAFCDGKLRRLLRLLIGAAPTPCALLRLRDGDGRTLGVACYLLGGGVAYYYQSGLRRCEDPRQKPGLCLHLLAMEHFLRRGQDRYDFMASDLRYKQSLSNSRRTLLWASVQRPRLRLLAERLATSAVRLLRERRGPGAAAGEA